MGQQSFQSNSESTCVKYSSYICLIKSAFLCCILFCFDFIIAMTHIGKEALCNQNSRTFSLTDVEFGRIKRSRLGPGTMIIVFFMFTRHFLSIFAFHVFNFPISSSIDSVIAYNNSQGHPVRNSVDKASSTMMKGSVLRATSYIQISVKFHVGKLRYSHDAAQNM